MFLATIVVNWRTVSSVINALHIGVILAYLDCVKVPVVKLDILYQLIFQG